MFGYADGQYGEYICAPGRAVVGFRSYTGVWIDNIQVVCGRITRRGIEDPRPEGPLFGGGNPVNNGFTCPGQSVAREMFAIGNADQPYLGYIKLDCVDPMTGSFVNADTGYGGMRASGALGDAPGAGSMQCSEGEFIIGVRVRTDNFLRSIGLICGPADHGHVEQMAAAAPEFTALIGAEASLQASNAINRYMRHRNLLAYVDPLTDELSKADASFTLVSRGANCIAFESKNYPGQFLRHQNWRLKLAPDDGTGLFRSDSTFCLVKGLADSTGVSFQSQPYPNHYIRHRNFELWVDEFDGTDLFRQDATFNVAYPGGGVAVR